METGEGTNMTPCDGDLMEGEGGRDMGEEGAGVEAGEAAGEAAAEEVVAFPFVVNSRRLASHLEYCCSGT